MKTKLFLTAAALAALLGGIGAQASTFGSVQGKVTDPAGKPLAGVKVTLAGGGSATTDKSGSYDLEGIDPGDYQLKAAKAGYQTTSVNVTITQDVPQEADLTLSQP